MSKQINLRIDEDLLDAARRLAKEGERSLSGLMRLSLQEWLKRHQVNPSKGDYKQKPELHT